MSRRIALTIACGLVGLVLFVLASQAQTTRPADKPRLRVGTFDSRAVVVVWVRSEQFQQDLKRLRAEYDKAKAANDEKRAKQLEAEGKARQDRIHEQGFGAAAIPEIVARIQDQLAATARQAGVDIIIRKADVAYHNPAVELMDVTDLLVQQFKPDEETLKTIEALLKHPPTDLEPGCRE
ncbi:MAG: hypothetical protein SVT52_05265 [Planctomycetota bacterium]|nr:hypothetical protein [Planctomycetota bacterium]